MYAALFEMDSMFGKHHYIFQGNTPEAIVIELENEQSLECLIRHGRRTEDAAGQAALDDLELFYNKYVDGNVTMADIASLDITISIGAIKCLTVAEGVDAIASLKKAHPNAR